MKTYKIYSREHNTDNYELNYLTTTEGFDSWKQWLTDNDAWFGHKINAYETLSFHVFSKDKEIFNTYVGYNFENYAEDEESN